MGVDVFDSQVDAVDVILTAVFLIVVTLIAVGVYKSMERPRLAVSPTEAGPRARRGDLIKYAISAPFLVIAWYGFFSFILFLAPGHPSPSTLLVMPLAVVVAVRFLAHVNVAGAYQLSSVVPMVIIASILLGEGLPDEAEVDQVLSELDEVDLAWTAILVVFLFEYAFTTVWYWLQVRRGHDSIGSEPRANRRATEPTPVPVAVDPADESSPETGGGPVARPDEQVRH